MARGFREIAVQVDKDCEISGIWLSGNFYFCLVCLLLSLEHLCFRRCHGSPNWVIFNPIPVIKSLELEIWLENCICLPGTDCCSTVLSKWSFSTRHRRDSRNRPGPVRLAGLVSVSVSKKFIFRSQSQSRSRKKIFLGLSLSPGLELFPLLGLSWSRILATFGFTLIIGILKYLRAVHKWCHFGGRGEGE